MLNILQRMGLAGIGCLVGGLLAPALIFAVTMLILMLMTGACYIFDLEPVLISKVTFDKGIGISSFFGFIIGGIIGFCQKP